MVKAKKSARTRRPIVVRPPSRTALRDMPLREQT